MASIQAPARAATTTRLRYSDKEAKLLVLLSKRAMSSSELTQKLYDGEEIPHHARESVTSMLRSLIKKVEINNEPFIITKTAQRGPYPTQYKKVKKA